MRDADDPKRFPIDDGTVVWDALVERLEQFLAEWETAAAPPRVADYLADAPPALRPLLLTELLKADLELRWRRQRAPRTVEQYLAEFPELADDGRVPVDLVVEEYHVRKGCGLAVSAADYRARFPELSGELAPWLELESTNGTGRTWPSLRPDKLEVGETIDDFELQARLGQGAFATVFLARQRSLQRLVALKISADQGLESQTLAQLDHAHIVRVYDQRRVAERNLRLMYMQYLPGGTLQEALAELRQLPLTEWNGRAWLAVVDLALDRRGETAPVDSSLRRQLEAMTWPEVVCWVGAQLASALQHAHQRGVLHRDVKPGNILLTRESAAKLVDFNISYCCTLEGAAPAAYFGGSLAYMSPEQLEAFHPQHARTADSLDQQSDLYALGVVLWEMLTARRPFDDQPLDEDWAHTLDAMIRIRRAGLSPAQVESGNRQLPGLGSLLARLLSPEPARRCASGREVSCQLQLCALPDGQRFLQASESRGRAWTRRWPALTVLLLALLPNAAAAVFNLAYNHSQIVTRLQGAQGVFFAVQGAINGLAFPLGLAWVFALVRPIAGALRGARAERRPVAPDQLAKLGARCLGLGHAVALIGIAEWTIAGLAYPLAMRAAGVAVSFADCFHFLASLTLCGIIAAAYPFFGVTAIAVQAFYPRLIGNFCGGGQEVSGLSRLQRTVFIYLGLAAVIPLLGVALLVTLGGAHRVSLAVVSIGGLLGLILVFWLARVIHRDLSTLTAMLRISAEAPA